MTHFDNFSLEELVAIRRHLPPTAYILDPFTGDGTIHQLSRTHGLATIGVSIEPEHAANPFTLQANPATDLVPLFGANRFDAVVTLPPLGDSLERHRRKLGRHPSPENPAAWRFFSDAYRYRMWQTWQQVVEVLKPGGVLIVGLRSFNVEGISTAFSRDYHLPLLVDLGLVDVGSVAVAGDTGRRRKLHLLRKPSTAASSSGRVCCCRETVEVPL